MEPPRRRGKVAGVCFVSGLAGITPAWAGKSYCPATRSFWSWDHPRAGGEKSLSTSASIRRLGSPPHGQGKGLLCCPDRCFRRITPALAGKSGRSHHLGQHVRDHPRVGGEKSPAGPCWASWCTDHPRVGGEKCVSQLFHRVNVGSSPRRRGKGWCGSCSASFPGITPAWAGKRL